MKHPKTRINQVNEDQTQRTNIKSSKGKTNNIQTADLSVATLQARREWQDILKVIKEKNLQPRLLYPARISFKNGEIKSFTDSKSSDNSAPLNQLFNKCERIFSGQETQKGL